MHLHGPASFANPNPGGGPTGVRVMLSSLKSSSPTPTRKKGQKSSSFVPPTVTQTGAPQVRTLAGCRIYVILFPAPGQFLVSIRRACAERARRGPPRPAQSRSRLYALHPR